MSLRIKRCMLLLPIMAICAGMAAQKRGMSNPDAVFIEKGTISAGLSFGFDSWETAGENGFELLGIVQGLEGFVKQTDIAAQGAYFIKDNVSLGLKVGYVDTRVSIDSTTIAELAIPDRHINRQTINGALTCRGYIPLFDGSIVAMFCEGRLSGSIGYYKSYKVTDNGKEGDYNDIWSASAGLYPGISVFATHDLAFELSLPLLEGGVRWIRQEGTHTDGTAQRAFIKFKPGLVGLRMGLVYHF